MRSRVLRFLYRLVPFDLKGDCVVPPPTSGIKISCIINFYGRLDLLAGILHSLTQQDFPKEAFEVVLVEDRGGTVEGRNIAEVFSNSLQIVYAPLDKNFGLMGYSRNYGLTLSRGEYILFLDDDTVILQQNFLYLLLDTFEKDTDADAIVPHGRASYAVIKGQYDYHDPYFMTSRCTGYRRKVLADLGGFMAHFVGQEDVEFVTRFVIAGKRAVNFDELCYYHPPLLVLSTRKARAVGFSFFSLKGRYSWPVWLLLVLNCARHAPLVLLPFRRFKEQGRFGIGFLGGILDGIRGCKEQVYG